MVTARALDRYTQDERGVNQVNGYTLLYGYHSRARYRTHRCNNIIYTLRNFYFLQRAFIWFYNLQPNDITLRNDVPKGPKDRRRFSLRYYFFPTRVVKLKPRRYTTIYIFICIVKTTPSRDPDPFVLPTCRRFGKCNYYYYHVSPSRHTRILYKRYFFPYTSKMTCGRIR